MDNSENEVKIISCHPDKVPVSDDDFVANEDIINNTSKKHGVDIKSNYEHIGDVSEIEELDTVKDNNKNNDSYSYDVNNSKLNSALSTSTLEVHKETAVYSKNRSDKTSLLKDRSPTSGTCSDCNAVGERETSETSCDCCNFGDKDSDLSSLNNISITSQTKENLMLPGSIRVPIVGYETVEARAKFTMFKIHVAIEANDSGWFIFRRYTDFVHLNDQLKTLFPNFRLSLPPKRWFRSNFDSEFLEERLLGLQAFVDNVTGHRDICNSKPIREFFCFDDPPGPHDSLEESRAQCDCMEESVYTLKSELADRDSEIQILKEELSLYKKQVQLLSNRLKQLLRRSCSDRSISEKTPSPSSTGQVSNDAFLDSGDELITDKSETVTEIKDTSSLGNKH